MNNMNHEPPAPEQPAQPSPLTGLPPKLSNTRCLRLNKSDDDELKELCEAVKAKGWDLDIVTAIRESVNRGLPLVKERYAPLINETTTGPGAN